MIRNKKTDRQTNSGWGHTHTHTHTQCQSMMSVQQQSRRGCGSGVVCKSEVVEMKLAVLSIIALVPLNNRSL